MIYEHRSYAIKYPALGFPEPAFFPTNSFQILYNYTDLISSALISVNLCQ